MSRPRWRWPTSFAVSASPSLSTVADGSTGGQHRKVLLAIARCRTAALSRTSRSLHRLRTYDPRISYNSCPRTGMLQGCQGNARAAALAEGARAGTAAHSLCARRLPAAAGTGAAFSRCRTSGSSITCSFTPVPRPCLRLPAIHATLEPSVGFFSVLRHSWNQRLQFHPHVHCVIRRRRHRSRPCKMDLRPALILSSHLHVLSHASFAASSPPGLQAHSIEVSSSSTGSLLPLAQPRTYSPAWLRVLFRHDWVVYSRSGPSEDRSRCCALSWRIHSSRRHLELQAGRPLRPQRHLSLERFCARQQETAHAPGCRSVSAPLSATRAPPGFRAHSQLRLPRQPQTRFAPAAVLASSAAQRRSLLRQHHRPPIRLMHSGTARSAAQPCASSNGSPPRNSCFVLHLNQNGTQHEDRSTSSASARASARTQPPCLI